MQIRLGFVSNSSSSSFCIGGDAYKDVFELAQMMVLCRDWDEVDVRQGLRDSELFEIIEQDRKTLNPDTPISFNTCNYRTYIRKIDGKYVVQTCHNHDFHTHLDDIGHAYPQSLMDEAAQNGYGEDVLEYCAFHLCDSTDFWHPELRIWGRPDKYWLRNNRCKAHKWSDVILNEHGVPVCAVCAADNVRQFGKAQTLMVPQPPPPSVKNST